MGNEGISLLILCKLPIDKFNKICYNRYRKNEREVFKMNELRAKGNVYIWMEDDDWIVGIYDSYAAAEKAIRECCYYVTDERVKELIVIKTLWGKEN